MGKVERFRKGGPESWHGHLTAVTVAPEFRRMGLAARYFIKFFITTNIKMNNCLSLFLTSVCWARLMEGLEKTSEDIHDAYFVDLFVRVSNTIAIQMYKQMGYSVYRRVIGYYSGEEDAYIVIFSFIIFIYSSLDLLSWILLLCVCLVRFDMRKALKRDVEKKSKPKKNKNVFH